MTTDDARKEALFRTDPLSTWRGMSLALQGLRELARESSDTLARVQDLATQWEQCGTGYMSIPEAACRLREVLDEGPPELAKPPVLRFEAHRLVPDHNGEPSCLCGWTPTPPEFATRGVAVSGVHKHVAQST
jgi:hypothetical protein